MAVKYLKKTIIKNLFLSKKVFISAHKNIDLDAFASMAGFSLISKKLGKETYLVIEQKDIELSTKEAIEKLEKTLKIISVREAKELIDERSSLIVLDTNKPKLMECETLLDKFNKIIVIDHHAKTPDTLNTPNLFIEENATSASQLVAELLSSFKVKIPKSYATVLLSGIALDTNNFAYKMSRKAFYYCYYLTSRGGDINEAQMILKQDIKEYVNRSKMIADTQIINDEIAIAKGQRGRIYTSQELAKAADLLLSFKGIKNSFAIGYLDKNLIGVSARSVNKVNVGKIMEAFGGGGNKTEAAAKIENTTIKKVEEEILESINK